MVSWARAQGRTNNIVIVIMRSNTAGVGKKKARVFLGCEQSSRHRPSKYDADSCIVKRPKDGRDSTTKRCGCPFSLKGVQTGNEDEWMLSVVCGVHNHRVLVTGEGHSFVGRLSETESSLLVDMSKSLVKPKQILTILKERDYSNTTTIKTIYNVRHRNRVKEKAGKTEMQCLLSKLSEHKYFEWHRCSGGDDIVTDLFWSHPGCVDLLRAFPHVLIMDCTYKTNRYRLPLFEIVGVTSTNMTFSVAFAYISYEKEDNYIWALTRLRSLLSDDCLPGVIVTDRDLALMNAISAVFPTARHLLCRWHISKNVMANCKKKFGTKDDWDKFYSSWYSLVNSTSEDVYLRDLQQIESKFGWVPGVIDYLKDTWLIPFKEKFVAVWTDTCMHFGNTTSNR